MNQDQFINDIMGMLKGTPNTPAKAWEKVSNDIRKALGKDPPTPLEGSGKSCAVDVKVPS